ncbi:hypothetical protein [Pandoraea anhela]|nr:hypothetical protein [Pandoraea anhela]
MPPQATALRTATLNPLLEMPLTHADVARLDSRLGTEMHGLSTLQKTAVWFGRLNTRNDYPHSMVEELNDAMSKGLSHVVWGSKPAQYLEQGVEGGIFPHVAKVQQDYGLSSRFVLIPVAQAARQDKGITFEGPSGWLINQEQMRATIAREKPLFTQFLRLRPDASVEEVYRAVLAHLPNMSYPRLDANMEVAATLLGFGRSNGAAASRSRHRHQSEINSFNTHVDNKLNEAYEAEADKGIARFPRLPQFTKYNSPETTALLNTYMGESRRIHAELSHTINACDAMVSDGESLERIEVARLLATLSSDAPLTNAPRHAAATPAAGRMA